MKALNIYVCAAGSILLAAVVGCGETVDDLSSVVDSGNIAAGDAGNKGELPIDKSACSDPDTFTCVALINAGNPDACIADFGFSTNQVGKEMDDGFQAGDAIGFYGYNDKTDDASMIPAPNDFETEPAGTIESCDPRNDYALHLQLVGFNSWGAGVGMEWGGPGNGNCDESLHPGAGDPAAYLSILFKS